MAADRSARIALPVDAILPELVAELECGGDVVLEATPGGGKTTRVPPALLAAKFRGDREIIVLEPRRLAAKMAARRVAEELGEQVGQTVGYQFRFENVGGQATRIRFLTEGMFVRRLRPTRSWGAWPRSSSTSFTSVIFRETWRSPRSCGSSARRAPIFAWS